MDDIDYLYIGLDRAASGKQWEQLEVSAAISGEELTATPSSLGPSSQFAPIEIKVKVSGGASSGRSVALLCSTPNWSGDDWEHRFHFAPIVGEPDAYVLRLSNALRSGNRGRPMALSKPQALRWKLRIVEASGAELESGEGTLTLAATNVGGHGEDDMDRAFACISKLNKGRLSQ